MARATKTPARISRPGLEGHKRENASLEWVRCVAKVSWAREEAPVTYSKCSPQYEQKVSSGFTDAPQFLQNRRGRPLFALSVMRNTYTLDAPMTNTITSYP